jgi:hypothetical protein
MVNLPQSSDLEYTTRIDQTSSPPEWEGTAGSKSYGPDFITWSQTYVVRLRTKGPDSFLLPRCTHLFTALDHRINGQALIFLGETPRHSCGAPNGGHAMALPMASPPPLAKAINWLLRTLTRAQSLPRNSTKSVRLLWCYGLAPGRSSTTVRTPVPRQSQHWVLLEYEMTTSENWCLPDAGRVGDARDPTLDFSYAQQGFRHRTCSPSVLHNSPRLRWWKRRKRGEGQHLILWSRHAARGSRSRGGGGGNGVCAIPAGMRIVRGSHSTEEYPRLATWTHNAVSAWQHARPLKEVQASWAGLEVCLVRPICEFWLTAQCEVFFIYSFMFCFLFILNSKLWVQTYLRI